MNNEFQYHIKNTNEIISDIQNKMVDNTFGLTKVIEANKNLREEFDGVAEDVKNNSANVKQQLLDMEDRLVVMEGKCANIDVLDEHLNLTGNSLR